MFLLFTDFSYHGPYVGQIKSVLQSGASHRPVVDLMHDAPAFDPKSSAYLLAAYLDAQPEDSITIAVVDPGVGSTRRAIAVKLGSRWLLGPDNGLLAILARRSAQPSVYELPVSLDSSVSFHGRDVFAPAAVQIADGIYPESKPIEPESLVGWDWPDQLAVVLYIDNFGNAVTGLSADSVAADAWLEVRGRRLPPQRIFSDVREGNSFWYRNSSGLVELAANRESVAELLGLNVGELVLVQPE